MTERTLIGSVRTRAFRPVWLLEELGLPFTYLPLRPGSPEVLPFNPAGKVPVLVEGDLTLTDSTAILDHLALQTDRFTFAAGSAGHARQASLTYRLLDEFDAVLWTAARHSFVLPEEHRLPAIKDSLKWEFARNQARMVTELIGPFLMGEEMTVPDIILTHCLGWAEMAQFPALDPVWADYLARMRSRPAYERTKAR